MTEEKFDPWLWAFNALKQFRSKFGLQDMKLSNNQIVAVLIGHAQEGKTSLAMRLLGATKEEARRLKPILRGGREYGNSATQVATIYRAVGTEMTEERLLYIENEIKKAWRDKPNEISLNLPLRGGIAATVVDLVGLGPRDKEEHERAKELAKKWLYKADLLIYVCGADHIANLTPYDPEMLEIMNRWRVNKSGSIIVLTHAYEVTKPEDKEILKITNDPEEIFRKFQELHKRKIVKQLKQSDEEIDIDDLPLVLPVYLKLDSTDPILTEVTNSAFNIIKKLINENPIRFKVRAGFTYPKQLLYKIQMEQKRLKEKEKDQKKEEIEWKKKLRKVDEIVEVQKNKVKEVEKELKKIRDLKNNLRDVLGGLPECVSKRFLSKNQKINIPREEGKIGEKIQQIEKLASDFADKIEKNFAKSWHESLKQIPSGIQSKIKRDAQKAFRKMSRELHAYIKKEFLDIIENKVIVHDWFGGVKWRESWVELNRHAYAISQCPSYAISQYPCTVNFIQDRLERHFKPIRERKLRDIEAKGKEIEDILSSRKSVLSIKRKEKEEKYNEYKKWKEKHQRELEELKRDIKATENKMEKAKQYQSFLAKEFLNFWNKEVEKINKENNPVEILNAVARLNDAREVLEELITLEERRQTS